MFETRKSFKKSCQTDCTIFKSRYNVEWLKMHARRPKQHGKQVKRPNREKLPQQKVGRLEEHVNESRQYARKLEKPEESAAELKRLEDSIQLPGKLS